MEKTELQIRLAIRKEGAFVNAYGALGHTMEGAFLIGSILASVASNPAIWERWKALMSDIFASAVKDTFGQMPEMRERRAPEHERAGEA